MAMVELCGVCVCAGENGAIPLSFEPRFPASGDLVGLFETSSFASEVGILIACDSSWWLMVFGETFEMKGR